MYKHHLYAVFFASGACVSGCLSQVFADNGASFAANRFYTCLGARRGKMSLRKCRPWRRFRLGQRAVRGLKAGVLRPFAMQMGMNCIAFCGLLHCVLRFFRAAKGACLGGESGVSWRRIWENRHKAAAFHCTLWRVSG